MDSYEWILYAGAAVWAGFGLYLCLLARRQMALSRRISQMARLMEKDSCFNPQSVPSTD
jgi:CcmD family protein